MGLDPFPGIGSAFYHHLVIIFCFEIRNQEKEKRKKKGRNSGNDVETRCIRPLSATLAVIRLIEIKSPSAHPNTKLQYPRSTCIAKMGPQPILLILGAGPRLGSAIASKFASQNFKVVLASRSLSDGVYSPEGHLQISADLSDPGSVTSIFSAIKARLGAPPTIVVYNGAQRLINLPDDPFALPLEDVKGPLAVGWESAYVAAQEAVKGFSELEEEEEKGSAFEVGKTFIFTGNALNQVPLPEVFAFAGREEGCCCTGGIWGECVWEEQGISVRHVISFRLIRREAKKSDIDVRANRFYYADQRDSRDGRPVGQDLDGDAHAEMYWQLARKGRQENWLVTFTKEQGRVTYGGVEWDGTPYNPIS